MPKKDVTSEVIAAIQDQDDKDLIIAQLLLELANEQQRISDLELIIADVLGGGI